ncbi:MAG: glutaredoxin family protein [Pseudomonadota bacterium]
MKSIIQKFLSLSAATVAASCLYSGIAHAQQVYRIVGPDGKVTFSDKPPPATSNAKVSTPTLGSTGGASSGAGLPFELRQVVSKYPVTIYTRGGCAPCTSARNLLVNRGVPFTEKTIATSDDAEALQRISGESTLPFATIGGQQMKGFSDIEWTQFLNAAGYPASSLLPAGYRQPAATPLVAVAPPPASPAANAPTPAVRPATPAVQPAPSNPAGIRF